jgi:catechol 2,3-dioxygenase-like lactoylglutathione lyase family enzyme
VHGPLSHIDFSVLDPARSIPFYDAFLGALGYRRHVHDAPDFAGPDPRRASWYVRYPSGAIFGWECRPARGAGKRHLHDRYAPGPHHLAFHADTRDGVDAVYRAMRDAGATVLDAPREYGGTAYGGGYYAAFFADPDGVKLEVVHLPPTNPE